MVVTASHQLKASADCEVDQAFMQCPLRMITPPLDFMF